MEHQKARDSTVNGLVLPVPKVNGHKRQVSHPGHHAKDAGGEHPTDEGAAEIVVQAERKSLSPATHTPVVRDEGSQMVRGSGHLVGGFRASSAAQQLCAVVKHYVCAHTSQHGAIHFKSCFFVGSWNKQLEAHELDPRPAACSPPPAVQDSPQHCEHGQAFQGGRRIVGGYASGSSSTTTCTSSAPMPQQQYSMVRFAVCFGSSVAWSVRHRWDQPDRRNVNDKTVFLILAKSLDRMSHVRVFAGSIHVDFEVFS